MRRGLILFAGVALLLTFALWLTARVDKSPLTRSFGRPRVPEVRAGRDIGAAAAPRAIRGDDSAGTIRCRFDGDGEAGVLVAMGETVVEGSTIGADLNLNVPPGDWTVLWRMPSGAGLPLGQITVDGGEVELCQLSTEGWTVRGAVRSPAGGALADIDVNVCGDLVHTDEDGRFVGHARTRPCTVRALVRDGLLTRRSEPAEVSPFDAQDVALVIDDAPIAGMGLAFRMTATGARVRQVHEGTPAEEAGLEVGDVIVAVDGTPTAGLADDAFIALGTGREGSRVELVINRDGERMSMTFERERLEEVATATEEAPTGVSRRRRREALEPVGTVDDTGN